MNEPTTRSMAEGLTRGTADCATNPLYPRGCLVVQSGLAGGAETEGVRKELTARRDAGEKSIRLRLKRSQVEGGLPPEASP